MTSNLTKNIVKNERLNEEYYEYTHTSGLKILLYPMSGYKVAYALFATKYGSIDVSFKTQLDDKFTTVPAGIAHFLEHKLFESEDGDAFSLFAKTGASANAYTSFEKTAYLFSTTDNFSESLTALMGFVQAPYFTKESVDKEQGIIGQEIKMFEDNPGWRVFFNLLGGLYINHPVKIDIAGTVGSIAQIDKDLLYKCYDTFYNLNNMVVSIAGNFNLEETIDIIESSLKVSEEKIEIQLPIIDEPETVAKDYVEQRLPVSLPIFNFGYKQAPIENVDYPKYMVIYDILLAIIAADSNELYKELYDAGLVDSSFGSELFSGRGFCSVVFSGESRDPKLVKEKIINKVESLIANGIDEDSFLRAKKALYGKCISNFNDVEEVATSIMSAYFTDCKVYDILEQCANVTLEDVVLCLNKLNKDNSTLSVILPV